MITVSFKRSAFLALLCGSSLGLSGCVAAAIPILAAGAIVKRTVDLEKDAGLTKGSQYTATENGEPAKPARPSVKPGFASYRANATPPIADADGQNNSLNGEGGPAQDLDEMAAKLIYAPSPYDGFVDYSLRQAIAYGEAGNLAQSAIAVADINVDNPDFHSCKKLPMAVVIDLDIEGQGDKRPSNYSAPDMETLDFADTDGLARSVQRLRDADITIIWMSYRPMDQAQNIIDQMMAEGLVFDQASDFLSLNRSADDRKQLRRQAMADHFCILAIAGDEKGDFDELYYYLRKAEYADKLDKKIEDGWFLLPPPDIALNRQAIMNPIGNNIEIKE